MKARNVTGDEVGQAETLKTLRGALWVKLRHQHLVQKGEGDKGTLKRETVNDLQFYFILLSPLPISPTVEMY